MAPPAARPPMPSCWPSSPSLDVKSPRSRPRATCSRRFRMLISRLTSFTVFSVYLLDERREELSIAYAVGYPEEIVSTSRCRSARASSARPSPSSGRSCSTTSTPIRATWPSCPARKSQLAVPLRHKGKVIGALNLLSDQARRVHRARRVDPAPVRRARRPGHRQRPAVRVGARVRRDARDAGRDRPRDERHPRSRRAADAPGAPDQARHRLPHLRHRPARTKRREHARDEGGDPVRRRPEARWIR